jgi:hypothetical protein
MLNNLYNSLLQGFHLEKEQKFLQKQLLDQDQPMEVKREHKRQEVH